MAYIQDTTQTFTINLVLEGFGSLTMISVDVAGTDYVLDVAAGTWNPSAPVAHAGDSISIRATVTNTGDTEDTIYATASGVAWTSAPTTTEALLVVGASTAIGDWTFTMPAAATTITCDAGHVE